MKEIYTDGGCSPNPGKGAWAVVITENGEIVEELSGSLENTTNNIMEMRAVIEALKYDNNSVIYSDSAYIVDCIKQKWYAKWIKNNWKRKWNGEISEVKNKELWEEIIKLKGSAVFVKVKGHSDCEFNNRADELCIEARIKG